MTIQFNTIPQSNLRVPLFYAEINGAQTPYMAINRLLLLGQMHAGGSATPGQPVHIQGDPRTLFGPGSMLADMGRTSRANAPIQEIWALPMLDDIAGVAATGSIRPAIIQIQAKARGNANIASLAGGAPNTLDGVTLAAGDTVLLTAQTTGGQNGIYTVTTLGTGANGTWTRHTSFDAAGEFTQGMVVQVTSGTLAGNYELTTAGPYIVGTTVLTFTAYLGVATLVLVPSTVSVWVGDIEARAIVYTTDSSSTFATRLVAAINAIENRSVDAAIDGANASKVLLTARHKGTAGNSIWLDTDYYGGGSPLAAAMCTFVQMSGGSGDPDFTAALATLGDDEFDWIVGPYTAATTVAPIQTLLNSVSGRWSPFKQLYGHYLGVRSDTVSNLMTHGVTFNDPNISCFGAYRAASPNWKWAAALGGRMAAHLAEPPELSRPLHTLDLIGILPPKLPSNRPDQTDRQSLYWAGISSYHVDGKTKTASIDRIITSYRLNEWGSPDGVWLDVETRAQVMYSIRAIKAAITGNHGRSALMDENPEGLEGITTPATMRATIVHEYKRQNRLGVVENPDLFDELLIVERNSVDPNRIDVMLPADMVNQLRIVAVNYVSHLQYQSAA